VSYIKTNVGLTEGVKCKT